MPYKLVHVSEVKPGDTVFHGGKDRTVGKKDVRYGSFMGTTLFGDSYRLGQVPVKKVCISGECDGLR